MDAETKNSLKVQISLFIQYCTIDRGLSPHSVKAYRNDLERFREHLRASGQSSLDEISQISHENLQEFAKHLRGSNLSLNSQARVFSTIRNLFRYLVETDIISGSPAFCLDTPKCIHKLPPLLKKEEIAQVMRTVDGREPTMLRDRALLETSYSTAGRVSELVGLKMPDLELCQKSLWLTDASGRQRKVPLEDTAVEALTNYIEAGRPILLKNSSEKALFINRRGTSLTRQGIWRIFRPAGEEGIGRTISPSMLRNTRIAHLLEQGVSVSLVQTILGITAIQRLILFSGFSSDQ